MNETSAWRFSTSTILSAFTPEGTILVFGSCAETSGMQRKAAKDIVIKNLFKLVFKAR